MGKGRAPCCDKSKVKKGPWSPAEDLRLTNFIQIHGHTNWRALPKQAGLLRCGKSCRLRWINYLRPDVKRGNFTPQEEQTIINLHNTIGNKWSKIASYLPGRTDNEIKNVWNTHLKKRSVLTKKDGKDKELESLYSSASPSCTSSTSTTSLPDHQRGQDQSDPKKPNDEKPQSQNIKKQYSNPTHDHYNESKLETSSSSTSDSPTSSYGSNLSNEKTPNETSEFPMFNPDGDPNNEKFEIPLLEYSDSDFWELFDSLDPDHSGQTDPNAGENSTETEVECSQWLKLLENELGLTSDVDILPEDQNMEEITNNLEPEISHHGLDYFPIWPCSPQNLGI